MRPYIDCHNHIGRTINRVPPVGQNTSMCLARFAETSIYSAISMPTAVGSPINRGVDDIWDQNQVISRACQSFPDRFPIGLALIEPRFGEKGVEEVERAMSELNLAGIVGHPPVREDAIPFIEVAAARGGLCNLHLHDQLMVNIAQMFPQAHFIVHASSYASENLAKFDNVWFEVVQYPDGRGSKWDFTALANKVGQERIVFGADLPYYDYRFLQKILETADCSDQLKDRIAYQNIIPLIQHYNPNWQIPTEPIQSPRIYQAEHLWACNTQHTDRLTVYA